MSKDNLQELFHQLKNDFNVEDPTINHQERFLGKLNNQYKVVAKKSSRSLWKPVLSIAASIILLVALFFGNQQSNELKDLASISPEMAETQNFFTSTIEAELNKIQNESSPEAQSLIEDALKQMRALETNYEVLKQDLSESGNDKRVIYAMISNFQNRIELLENVLLHIEQIKQLKNTTNENSNTI